ILHEKGGCNMTHNNMHESKDNTFIPMTSIMSGVDRQVKPDLYYYTDQIANVIFIGNPQEGDWVLVDAGLPGAATEIKEVASELFGEDAKPTCIILTHGHFDHVGGLVDLLKDWYVQVYAHENELPYLTGQKSYPVPDSTVEGGMLAKISPMYPHEPIDLGDAVQKLPDDGSVPELPEWEWIHTPGHSPGHVSFYREKDGTLLPGDAFITVRQDSFYNVLMQNEEVNGPPRYLTTDWDAAWNSVKKLAALHPKMAIPGHGVMMDGKDLEEGLQKLVHEFDTMAIP